MARLAAGKAVFVLCGIVLVTLALPMWCSALTPNDVSLILAIDDDDNAQAVSLLNHGASANAFEAAWPNRTALMLAAWFGRPGLVKLLLARGANVNATDQDGETPLMWALQDPLRDRTSIALLLDHGANVNTIDKSGKTALMYAVGRRTVALTLGPGSKNPASSQISVGGSANSVKLLLAHKADVNVQDKNGETALMAAADTGSMDVVKLLVQAGARVGLTDHAGHNAQWYADQAGHKTVAQYLAQVAKK